MLLHEHPVNVERERAGRALANSLWFSGGGILPPRPSPAPSIRTYATTGIAAALARFAGSPLQPLPSQLRDALSDVGSADSIVVALDRALDVPAIERGVGRAGARCACRGLPPGRDIALRRRRRCHRVARGTARPLATPRRQLCAARSSRAARRRGSGPLMEIVRRIVPPASKALAAAGVNPVLARVFASRGVASADELDLDLSTLPGFATMKGIADAATRLADAIQRPREDRDHRRLRRRWRHRVRGRSARSRGDGRRRRLPGAESLRVRLRPHAGNRRRRRSRRAASHRDGRQWHREPRRRHGGGRTGHRGADHRSSPAGRHASRPRVDRQSESARMRLSRQASRWRRRHLLCAPRHPGRVAGTGPFHRPGRAQSRHAARPRRARHRGRRRVPRPDQPDARRAGTRANPCRSRATRHPGAAGRRGPRSAPGDGLRPGLRRRSPAQCRGAAFRHGARHSLPPRRHRSVGGAARRRAGSAQSRAPRRRIHDAGRGARHPRSAGARCRRRRCVHALPLPPRLASGRRRHRRGAAQGPVSPPDDRFRQRERQ